MQPQTYNATKHCVTMNLASAGTSPTIAQLAGTYFAAVVPDVVTPGAMFGSGRINVGTTRQRFEFSVREKASGALTLARVVGEDAAHGAGGDREEVGAILPLDVGVDQPQVGFVDQGDARQLVVDERHQAIQCVAIAVTPQLEQGVGVPEDISRERPIIAAGVPPRKETPGRRDPAIAVR